MQIGGTPSVSLDKKNYFVTHSTNLSCGKKNKHSHKQQSKVSRLKKNCTRFGSSKFQLVKRK